MKFGQQFEFHKIPEWYNVYLDYDLLKHMIEDFKSQQKQGELKKLPGFYVYTKHQAIISLDVFKVPEKKDTDADAYNFKVTAKVGHCLDEQNVNLYRSSIVSNSFEDKLLGLTKAKEQPDEEARGTQYLGTQYLDIEKRIDTKNKRLTSPLLKKSAVYSRETLRLDQEDIQEIKDIGGELTQKISQVMTSHVAGNTAQRTQSANFGSIMESDKIDIGISEYKEPKFD